MDSIEDACVIHDDGAFQVTTKFLCTDKEIAGPCENQMRKYQRVTDIAYSPVESILVASFKCDMYGSTGTVLLNMTCDVAANQSNLFIFDTISGKKIRELDAGNNDFIRLNEKMIATLD